MFYFNSFFIHGVLGFHPTHLPGNIRNQLESNIIAKLPSQWYTNDWKMHHNSTNHIARITKSRISFRLTNQTLLAEKRWFLLMEGDHISLPKAHMKWISWIAVFCFSGGCRPGAQQGRCPRTIGWSGWGAWAWSCWRSRPHLPCARAGPWPRLTSPSPGTDLLSSLHSLSHPQHTTKHQAATKFFPT